VVSLVWGRALVRVRAASHVLSSRESRESIRIGFNSLPSQAALHLALLQTWGITYMSCM
jgi:hypothetical protein